MTLGGEKEKFQIILEFIQNPGQETTFEICNTIAHDVFCVGLNTRSTPFGFITIFKIRTPC